MNAGSMALSYCMQQVLKLYYKLIPLWTLLREPTYEQI